MAVVRCDECDGWKDDDRFSIIALPKRDEEGFPILGRDGQVERAYVRLPYHVMPPSRFEPSGLAPAACRHGLAEHPDPATQTFFWRLASSWVRSRYLDYLGKCPVCRGEPAPDDMLVPANA